MIKLELYINKINIFFVSLILLVGLWKISVFFIPTMFLVALTTFIIVRKSRNLTLSNFILLLSLLLYEIINYLNSEYKANSILFLKDLFLIMGGVFLFWQLLKEKKIRLYFVIFISISAGLLALANIPIFFFRYYESAIHGFDDFSQFRFLYRPLGFLSNEWVTILLCFLPFPVIGLLLLWRKPQIRYIFLFILSLLIFNILISFSRAGILSFFVFVILSNFFIAYNRLFSIKKIFFSNIFLLLPLVLFVFCFTESICSSVKQTPSHQRSSEGRLKQWEYTIGKIDNTPYLGVGSKNYALLAGSSQQVDLQNSFTGRVNNTYIQLLIEKGWVGFFIWVSVVIILIFSFFMQIKSKKNKLTKAIDYILLSAIFAILFRELFFSSLLYNSGLLLFFFILLIFNHKESEKKLEIGGSVITGMTILFVFGALYFYFKKSDNDNALKYAEQGLIYERSVEKQVPFNALIINYYYLKKEQEAITLAIQLYEEACRLSPSDAMFHHNLGWLYWMNHRPDLAYIHISQSIKLDPNIALYHISKGLIIESKNTEEAFESYMQAILLSPDLIDSSFFQDLLERNSLETKELLKVVHGKLKKMLSSHYSSIIEAKDGKLLFSFGKNDEAYKVFSHVTQIHPNLSRPWFYLGVIEQKKGNFEVMQNYYKKSLFLSSDHLPLYALACYYKQVGDTLKSNSYFNNADKIWKNKSSIHSSRCRRIYFLDAEKDDVIPSGLLDYTTPKLLNLLNM